MDLHAKFSDCFEQLLSFINRQYDDYNLGNYTNLVTNYKPTNILCQLEQAVIDECNKIVNRPISERVFDEFRNALKKIDKGEKLNISLEKNQTTCSLIDKEEWCEARSFMISCIHLFTSKYNLNEK